MSLSAVVCTVIVLSTVSANKNALNDFLFSGDFEFIDLTHTFDNKTVYWPGNNKFGYTKKIEGLRSDGSWYAAYEFAAAEHGGTHIDAPYHFWEQGQQVSELPLEKLIVPLIIVDVSSLTNGNPDFVLTKHHLDDGIINYNFGKPCVLVFKFGWSKYFNDVNKYLGLSNEKEKLNFPGLGADLVEWITTSYKNVVGIGVDVASIDPGSSRDFPAHKLTASHGLYNLENVNLSDKIPEYGCAALMLPMKIAHGTGAPLRMVAICPKQPKSQLLPAM